MSNVTRVLLNEGVSDLVAYEATQAEAYNILNAAVDIQEREQRAMSLEEALRIVRGVAERIEAMGM